ncbi:MAG: hypothetical protein H8E42_12905 [Nitrospinae bacterium]|nr:hypothetical protein [Nitrospinota bacterium]MBL7021324.1 hypothetical protein [Nitrospinaceae bacterium]
MKKTGSFRKSGSNSRKPQNRQGNATGNNQNQNQRPNSGQRKGGIHPWVSSSPSSSQALTSHISIASKNSSGSSNTRKPQNAKNPYRPKRNNSGNPTGPSGEKPSYRERGGRGTGRAAPPSQQSVDSSVAKNPSVSEKPLTGGLDAFSLFCAYHLGIGPKKEYRPANLNEVARRFGNDPATVRQALKECDMDSAALLDRDFDMALAQLDIQVAPEGIDRMELAKSIYEDFLASPHVKRDWKKILEEDRKENSKVFGG